MSLIKRAEDRSEAISHLDNGLELVSTLPRSSERDARELGLPLSDRLPALAAIEGTRGRSPGCTAFSEPSESIASRGEGERRQLTVLFCDMVSTELTNRDDPEALLAK